MDTMDFLTAQFELEARRACVIRGMQIAQLLSLVIARRYLAYRNGWLAALSDRLVSLSGWLRQRYHLDATDA